MKLFYYYDRDFMDSVCTHTLGIIRRSAFMVQGSTDKFYEQLSAKWRTLWKNKKLLKIKR